LVCGGAAAAAAVCGGSVLYATCDGDAWKQPPQGTTADDGSAGSASDGLSFAERQSKDAVATASGLRVKDLVTGTGAVAQAGQYVEVHYAGALETGEAFDSSYDRGEPFMFQLGARQVIRGWDEGVAGMAVGGRRVLVIPSSLAYGSGGIKHQTKRGYAIPPDATLYFTVQLVSVSDDKPTFWTKLFK